MEYLQKSGMPRVTDEIARDFYVPITIEEFLRALKFLKLSKAPGPDGYTLLYYKSFTEKLAPRFIAVYNSLREGQKILTETLLAHITVFPKEGKDPSQCSSYCPISLINVN